MYLCISQYMLFLFKTYFGAPEQKGNCHLQHLSCYTQMAWRPLGRCFLFFIRLEVFGSMYMCFLLVWGPLGRLYICVWIGYILDVNWVHLCVNLIYYGCELGTFVCEFDTF